MVLSFDRTCLYWWINPIYVVISIKSAALPVMILYDLTSFWISNFSSNLLAEHNNCYSYNVHKDTQYMIIAMNVIMCKFLRLSQ